MAVRAIFLVFFHWACRHVASKLLANNTNLIHFSINNTTTPSKVTRSSTIKSPVPTPITHAAGSVASELTTPNTPVALFQTQSSDDEDDDVSFNYLVNEEHEKCMCGGDGAIVMKKVMSTSSTLKVIKIMKLRRIVLI